MRQPSSTTNEMPVPTQAKRRGKRPQANGHDHDHDDASVAAAGGALDGAGVPHEGLAGPEPSNDRGDAGSGSTAPPNAEDLAKAAEATGKGGIEIRADDYGIRGGCLVGFKRVQNDEVPFKLGNFTARITHELHTSAGTRYRIEARLQKGEVRRFILTTAEFSNPRRWVAERLGAAASVTVGQHERLTAAIEAVSRVLGFARQDAADATGYTTHNGALVFVAPNRVIAPPGVGTSGLIMDLPDEVRRYSLAEPPVGVDRIGALAAAARVLEVGDLAVTLPPWLQAFRAAMPFVPPAAFVVWLYGVTGTLKSSFAALCLNLFGRRWNYRELTATFLDTGTAIEAAIHYPRGMLAVLDDAVADSKYGSEAVAGVAGRVLRSVGNGAARGRSRPDLTRHPDREPRAAVIATSERLPPGGSGSAAARALAVHVKAGDIDKAKLTLAQRDGRDGVLESAMSAFIQVMLGEDQDGFTTTFGTIQSHYRDQAEAALRASGAHGRTVDAVGDLMATAEVVIGVFKQEGVLLPFDAAKALSVLTASGGTHRATTAHGEPIQMFRRTLRELIESGRLPIADTSTGRRPQADADAWGWPPGGMDALRGMSVSGCADIEDLHEIGLGVREVYLRRGETYRAVLEALGKEGEALGLDLNSMWNALIDRGLVLPDTKAGKQTVRKRMGGVQNRFMRCKVEILSEEDDDARGRQMPEKAPAADDADDITPL